MLHDIRLAELGLQPPPWQGPEQVFPLPAPSQGLRSRYRGCLVGGAIGDALGRPVEGLPAHDVRHRYPAGLRDFEPWRGWRAGPTGTFTDDTQLTIVVSEWLIRTSSGQPDALDLSPYIIEWGRTGRGMGRATRQALSNYDLGLPWWEAGVGSAGNGAAMRAAPYGLRYAGEPDRLRRAAALGSAPTHADITAVASAIVQAAAVNQCLVASPGGLDPDQFLMSLVASVEDLDLPELALRSGGEARSLTHQIEEVYDFLGRRPQEVFDHFYNGAFVLETTPVVLWCLLSFAEDPEEALVTAVMGGRDSDTIAAILGNLLGALHGEHAFPARWTGPNLEDADRLVALADGLYDLRWAPPVR